MRAYLKAIVLLGAVISWAFSEKGSAGCSCHTSPYVHFQCIGLFGDDGGAVIRKSLTACLRQGSHLDVNFYEMSLSDLPDNLFSGYTVTTFRCISCSMKEFPPSFMSSFGNHTRFIEIRSSVISAGVTNKTWSLPFQNRLDKLWFTHTEISEIESNAFSSFRALDQLIINYCPKVRSIQDFAFANMPKLTWLELCSSNVRYIYRHTFWDLPSLRYLHLYGNRISSLQNGTFSREQQPMLRTLLLFDNPWKCSCDLQWLKDYLKRNPNILSGEDAKCVSPNSGTFPQVDFCSDKFDDNDFTYFDPYTFLSYLISGFS